MVVEVIVIAVLVVFLLRNFTRPQFNQPPDPRHSPTHRQKEHQPAPLDFRLEVGQKVEEVQMVKTTLPVSLNMSEKALQPYKTKTQVSPTPSLADSSSSGCESAFSFPNSNCTTTSRDPSPVDGNRARGKSSKSGSKKQQKKRRHEVLIMSSPTTKHPSTTRKMPGQLYTPQKFASNLTIGNGILELKSLQPNLLKKTTKRVEWEVAFKRKERRIIKKE